MKRNLLLLPAFKRNAFDETLVRGYFKKLSVWIFLCLSLLTGKLSAQNVDFPAGSYYINMGVTPQTIGNGLKPYGLLYDLLKNDKINIYWYINPAKVKDGIDMVVGTTNLRGGVFIIPSYFRSPAINAKIAAWNAKGVVGVTSTQVISLPQDDLNKLRSAPRWTLDRQNGAIAADYFVYAEIPPSAHGGSNSAGWDLPSELDECDDLFIMPHADPEWATHENLLYWNEDHRGSIWAACHAASAIENMVDPADRTVQTNFLTQKDPAASLRGTTEYAVSNSLILWGDHDDATLPYTSLLPTDPVSQYMGTIDAATTNGSEQVYVPRQGLATQAPNVYNANAIAGWNPGVNMLVYDPTHPDVTNPDLVTLRNVAGIMLYGRAFDDPNRGWVMYEAGHAHDRSTGTANIAAMRAFFNFSFLSMADKTVVPEINNIPEIVYSGEAIDIGFEFLDRINPNLFQIEWRSSCGGTFTPSNGLITSFSPPAVLTPTECLISVSITDGCTRGATDIAFILVEANPSWTLTKTSAKTPNDFRAVGEIIPYELVLENTGDVSVSNVVVSDPQATSGPTYVSGDLNENNILNVGEIWIYTASYSVTQADIDAGSFTNTATATGTPGGGTLAPVFDSETVDAVQLPALGIDKSITSGSTYNKIGQSITYTYRVTNTGNVTLPGPIQVIDDKIPSIASKPGPLAPGAFVDFTASYTVTLQDLVNGSITNTAYAQTVFNTQTVQSATDQATATVVAADLSLNKIVSKARPNVGETVTFTIQVTNSGPNPVTGLIINDLLPNGYGTPVSISSGGVYNSTTRIISWSGLSVANGATISLTFQTQILGVGPGVSYSNYAEVIDMDQYDPDSTPNNGSENEDDDDRESVSPRYADLSVIKRQVSPDNLPLPLLPSSPGMLMDVDTIIAGTKIYYYIRHQNLGPDTSFSVTLQDFIPSGMTNVQYSINFGNSWSNWNTGTNLYANFPTSPGVINAMIRGDIDPAASGILTNTIQINSAITYDPVNSNNQAIETSRIVRVADLLLNKTQLEAPVEIGGPIKYNIHVVNLGPSDATGVVLHDAIDTDIIGNVEYSVDGGMTWLSGWTGNINIGDFKLDEEFTLQIRGTVLDKSPEPNIDPIPNTAEVTSTSIDPDLTNNKETIETKLSEIADIAIVKIGPENICAGEEITYTITVSNLSNTFDARGVNVIETLDLNVFENIQVSYDNGMSWTNITTASEQFDLPDPFEKNSSYTFLLRAIVKSDLQVTSISNTITVESDGTPDNILENNEYTAQTNVDYCSDISTLKTLVTDPDLLVVGEPIEFLITFVNHGPSIARNLTVTDIIPDGIDGPYTFARCNTNTFAPWPGTFVGGSLEAGGTCFINLRGFISPDYSGSASNIACVTSSSVDVFTDDNCDTLDFFIYNPSVEIVKTADKKVNVKAGETVTYTYVVTNTGNAPLSNVVVTDDHGGTGTLSAILPASVAILAPGASATFTSEYVVTQQDIDLDLDISNTATVTGSYEIWTYTDTDDEIIDLEDPNPVILIDKEGDWTPDFPGDYPFAGDVINYTFTITNTGNVTLTNPQVSDPLIGQITCADYKATLLPGESFNCTGSYTITQVDLDAGHRENTASVTAKDPKNNNVTDQDTKDVMLPQLSQIAFIKKGSQLSLGTNDVANPGDIVTFNFELTNTGNVTLSNVQVLEVAADFTGTGTLPIPMFVSNNQGSPQGTLKVGETATFVGFYAITQQDINVGYINNRAKGTANGPLMSSAEDLSDSSNQNDPNETGVPADPLGDDPTFTFIPHNAVIGVAKSLVSVTKLPNSNFDVRYKIRMGNPGNLILQYLRLEDDVPAQLGNAYVALKQAPQVTGVTGMPMLPAIGATPQQIYDGTGGRLAPGEIIELEFVVEVNPDAPGAPVPLFNQAYVAGIPTNGMNVPLNNQQRPVPGDPFQFFPYEDGDVTDLSDSGTDIDGENTDDPGNQGTKDDPTPTPIPSIDVAKALINIGPPASGTIGNKNLTFRFRIQNSGNTDITRVQLADPIASELAPIWVGFVGGPQIVFSNAIITPIINTTFNGLNQPNMFLGAVGLMAPGQIIEVHLTVEVDPNKDSTYPALTNQATATGVARLPKGGLQDVSDRSDDGYKPQGPNPEYPGDKGTPDDPTPIIVPEISAVKTVDSYADPLSGIQGHADVLMDISIKNVGNVPLSRLSLRDTIELSKYFGNYFVGMAPGTQPVIVSSNATQNPVINTGFNGRISQPNIFNGTSGLLLPGQIITVRIRAEINGNLTPAADRLWNRASGSGIASRSNGTPYLDTVGQVYYVEDETDAGTKFEDINIDQPEDEGTEDDRTVIALFSNIGDFVWSDLDFDGIQDPGEPGLKNVTVQLFTPSGQLVATTTSGTLGYYSFNNIIGGQYYLKFSIPKDYYPTVALAGNNRGLDNNVTEQNGPGTTSVFTLVPSTSSTDVDAGFYPCAKIGEWVWYDVNKNDVRDKFENGLNGLKVNLYKRINNAWVLVESTFTGHKPGTPSDDGWWNFCVSAGQYYVEIETPPFGLVKARPNQGPDRSRDSDITDANGKGTTNSFTIANGQSKLDIGAGYYPQAVIGNLVWMDENLNGQQDDNEPKIEGAVVRAIDANTSEVLSEAVTDVHGVYELDEIEKRNVYLSFELPLSYQNYGPTLPRLGSDLTDSDVDGTYGPFTTRSMAMYPGDQNPNLDLGIALGLLPLEWLDVRVSKNGEGHLLEWETAREVNVSHFEIERRRQGENTFTKLPVTVPAGVNSSGRSVYSTSDDDTAMAGWYTYRIKQVDADGKFSYSKEVAIQRLAAFSADVYPNPAKDQAKLTIQLSQQDQIDVQLFDAASRLVKNAYTAQSLDPGRHELVLDLASLQPGVYMVQVKGAFVSGKFKLIVLE